MDKIFDLIILLFKLIRHYNRIISDSEYYASRFRKYRSLCLQILSICFEQITQLENFYQVEAEDEMNDDGELVSFEQSLKNICKSSDLKNIWKSSLSNIATEFELLSIISNKKPAIFLLISTILTEKLFVICGDLVLTDDMIELIIAGATVDLDHLQDEKNKGRQGIKLLNQQCVKILLIFVGHVVSLKKGLEFELGITNLGEKLDKLTEYFSLKLNDKIKLSKNELDLLILINQLPGHRANHQKNLKLADMLLTQITRSRMDIFLVKGEEKILDTVSLLLSNYDAEENKDSPYSKQFYTDFSPKLYQLIGKIRDQNTKNAMIKCLEKIDPTPSKIMTNMIKDLNSYNLSIVGEIDSVKRIAAYNYIINILEDIDEFILEIALEQALLDIKMAVEVSMLSILEEFFNRLIEKFSKEGEESNILQRIISSSYDMLKCTITPGYFSIEDDLTESNIDLEQTALNKKRKIRSQFIDTNRKSLIRNWPEPNLQRNRDVMMKIVRKIRRSDYAKLLENDETKMKENEEAEETDILLNLFHIQVHRRNKALERLSKKIKNRNHEGEQEINLTGKFIESALIPICKSTICDSANRENNYLIDSAINLLGYLISNCLGWARFKYNLYYFLNLALNLSNQVSRINQVKTSQAKNQIFASKMVSKIVVSILKQRSFNISEEREGKNNQQYIEVQQRIIPKILGCMNEGKNILSRAEQVEGIIDVKELNYKRLADNMNLAIACIDLAKKIKNSIVIEKIVFKVTSLLRSKNYKLRQIGMNALESICQADLLEMIIQTIFVQLNLKGFHKHVQIYAINRILEKIDKDEENQENGENDEKAESWVYLEASIPTILNLVNTNLFQEKDLEEQKQQAIIIQKTPEAKGRPKSYNILRLLGKKMKIGTKNWDYLIRYFVDKLKTVKMAENVTIIKNCLDSLVSSMRENFLGTKMKNCVEEREAYNRLKLSLFYLYVEHYPDIRNAQGSLLSNSDAIGTGINGGEQNKPIGTSKIGTENKNRGKTSNKYIDEISSDCFVLQRTTKTKKVSDSKFAKNTSISLLIFKGVKGLYWMIYIFEISKPRAKETVLFIRFQFIVLSLFPQNNIY